MRETGFRLFVLVALASITIALCPRLMAAAEKTAPGPAQAGAGGQSGKIAFINSDTLQDQIGEYKAKIDALNRQFEPRVKEIQTLNDRINALQNTIQAQTGALAPTKIAEMTEQLSDMKRDQQRKTEDLQTDGNRAKDQMLTPVKEKIAEFLKGYSSKHGIALVIDLANAIDSNSVVWYDRNADITADFVKEYNAAYPVPGAAAAAPAKQP
jgi:Skp family chaperone for outer membrane proteins